MNQKNTTDISKEAIAVMVLIDDVNLTPTQARRMLRKSMRFAARCMPLVYCSNIAKYPTLIIKDYS